jgi:hypothetical protein
MKDWGQGVSEFSLFMGSLYKRLEDEGFFEVSP